MSDRNKGLRRHTKGLRRHTKGLRRRTALLHPLLVTFRSQVTKVSEALLNTAMIYLFRCLL
ncbi:MAG: hypothetical protein HC840_32150 [Leptolyngbyaceae cyanobacterium RM2_2_4]|nr:hypothetical protein [Leptolyngbyaceae cyanobacterium SM1_4_3]NJO53289.1 hypothetical protein [Leptolyngbyaceae cyanobacterium RM2_2_4]